jgi:hypothetical protein
MVQILPLRLLLKRFTTAFDGVALPKLPAADDEAGLSLDMADFFLKGITESNNSDMIQVALN